jgi:uncharacterized membrane protein YbhN (UPF0104 family)
MIKKILTSKITRVIFSLILIYIAFRRVDFLSLLKELSMVSIGSVVMILIYMSVSMLLGGCRWSVLVLDKVRFRDILYFTKASYIGGFYGLFFPTTVAGDLLKWTSLKKRYPEISKTKLASTALVDRVIGFSAFSVIALLALIAGKLMGYKFPEVLLWLFLGINAGLLVFFTLINVFNFDNFFKKIKYGEKLLEIIFLLKKENKKKILLSFLISVFSEPIWMGQTWLVSQALGGGLSLMSVFIFMPIISLILVLPISWAGFGAREQLFLYFFGQLGVTPEKILAVSTLNGVIGILNSLLGGVFLGL